METASLDKGMDSRGRGCFWGSWILLSPEDGDCVGNNPWNDRKGDLVHSKELST
jgi:hypothetical protein